jgi:outer membrane protein OmpA-like peptidoglycan-associated protein
MALKLTGCVLASSLLFTWGCAKKPAATPAPVVPPPKQNLVVLLPNADGKPSSITVSNSGGSQILNQTNQATRVERADTPPVTPFIMDQVEVRRVFGAAIDALPPAEMSFVIYFIENSDALPEDAPEIAAILQAIQDRHGAVIRIIGHTDTTADPEFNYKLGLRRAQRVSDILQQRGVAASSIFIASHGQADLAVPTGPNKPERRNRRAVVVVQ